MAYNGFIQLIQESKEKNYVQISDITEPDDEAQVSAYFYLFAVFS
jgi:hypothetical protein